MNEKQLREALDRLAIIESVNRVALLADAREWEELRLLFTDTVAVDYTSLAGGDPAPTVPVGDLIAGWRGALSGFQATQHLIGSHLVTLSGDTAECVAYFVATHLLSSNTGGNTWTLGGRYDYSLVRSPHGEWKIRSTKMTALWGDGNQSLLEKARASVAAAR